MLNVFQTHLGLIQTSPTLDLVNDYFRFVIGFFEVIGASAPHIYHSALPLSPTMSMVHRLYKSYAHPLAKIVRGLPISWEPTVVTTTCDTRVTGAAWSPCGRFIAVACVGSKVTVVLDAATLEQLKILESPQDSSQWLSFSPDSRSLTMFTSKGELASWDLQTGGPISTTCSEASAPTVEPFSSAYSMDGKMIAVAYQDTIGTAISTYNLISGECICSHRAPEGKIVAPVWIHGEYLQFVTVKPGSITIWEVGFTMIHTLAEVKTFSAPDNIGSSGEHLFLPNISRLAFTLPRAVLVWDIQGSRCILNFMEARSPRRMSFSPDGCFFACGNLTQDIYLWKESPTGYILHQKITSGANNIVRPLLSPTGGSLIVFTGLSIELLHTKDSIIPSSIPTQPVAKFLLEFSTDETLSVVARLEGSVVTVIDLKSGNPWLIINTGMRILCLRVTESTVVVVGEGKVVTWNLPTEDYTSDPRATTNGCIQTTTFNYPQLHYSTLTPHTSISPTLDWIAVISPTMDLSICSVSTGECVIADVVTTYQGYMPWFTPDGYELWCMQCLPTGALTATGWTITEDNESDLIKLEPLESTTDPSGGFPWQSPSGYGVTHTGWVVNPDDKPLLWLPHYWRAYGMYRTWGKQFLGLLHGELPEAVILELGD